jgi:glycosyltransferase involved in cell wall biosynthesis
MSTELFPTSMSGVAIPTGQHKVAIIMRTKDRALLLHRALCSVLEQKYQQWHLYVVNDGGDVIPVQELEDLYRPVFDGRLTVIHNQDSCGMEGASNIALTQIYQDQKTGFVCVHDDDDSWHPMFLSECVGYLEDNPDEAAVCSRVKVVHERVYKDLIFTDRTEDWAYLNGEHVRLTDLAKSNPVPPISMLVRMSVMYKLGKFNSQLPVLGDWEFTMRLAELGDIGILPNRLANYHHRIDADGAAANSVHGGADKHARYNTLLVNSLVRQFVRAQPGNLGLIHMLQKDNQALKDEIVRLHFKLDEQRQYQEKIDQKLDQLVNRKYSFWEFLVNLFF